MIRSTLKEISTYLPERRVTNNELTELINSEQHYLSDGVLDRLFGIKERRFAKKDQQVSDLAVNAAIPILEKVGKEQIDFLIFAAACSDLIEPATSNIIQSKLGLHCPCLDIKNACNSVVSAMQAADAYIKAGIYNNILIVCGEKLSDAINYQIKDLDHLKRAMASLTLGDAGAALLMSSSNDESGLYLQKFMTEGSQWDLCTIQGGGSMYPHDSFKNYFEGKTTELKDAMIDHCRSFVLQSLQQSEWDIEAIDHVITHQVSNQIFDVIADNTGLDKSKIIQTFERYGNTASASIPLAIAEGVSSGLIKKGDKIAIIGLAAGLSVSVQMLIW